MKATSYDIQIQIESMSPAHEGRSKEAYMILTPQLNFMGIKWGLIEHGAELFLGNPKVATTDMLTNIKSIEQSELDDTKTALLYAQATAYLENYSKKQEFLDHDLALAILNVFNLASNILTEKQSENITKNVKAAWEQSNKLCS